MEDARLLVCDADWSCVPSETAGKKGLKFQVLIYRHIMLPQVLLRRMSKSSATQHMSPHNLM